jgi:HlyD family secretion protein
MTAVLQLFLKRSFVRAATRWLVFVLVVGGGAFAAYFAYRRFSIPQVQVTDVVQGPVVQAFYATGTLLPDREYPVKAAVEGTLVEVLVDKGSQVIRGQTIGRIYVEEFSLKQTQAQADLELQQQLADPETSPALLEFDARIRAAEKQLEIATREYERLAQLRESGGRTLSELDRADEMAKTALNTLAALKSAKQTKILELQRDLKTAQAQLDIAKWNIEQQTLLSPIDGVVLDWPTSTGTRVRVNDTITTVADVRYDRLVMRTNVDEEDKTRVRLDQTVHMTLYAYPNRVFDGRVRKVYPKADPARRTFEVDVEIEEPAPDFAAGMTGELAFVVDRKDLAVVVPSQSVQAGQVWLVRKERLVPAEVTVGLRSIQRAEILSGLEVGDQVLVSPIGNLGTGDAVHATHLDADLAAGLNTPATETPGSFKGVR